MFSIYVPPFMYRKEGLVGIVCLIIAVRSCIKGMGNVSFLPITIESVELYRVLYTI